jgi:starch synthase
VRITIFGIKNLPAFAGVDRMVENLLANLPGDNEYYVYLLRCTSPQVSPRNTIHYIYIPSIGGKHFKPFVYFFFCAVHFLFAGSCDIAHVHNSEFGFFLPLLRLRRKVKIIGTFHGNPYMVQKWGFFARVYFRLSELLFIRLCHRLTSVSRRESHYPYPILFIPNGMDRFSESTNETSRLTENIGLARNEYLLFACGRLDPIKGLHHLLAAYIEGQISEKLLIIGDFIHNSDYSLRIREMVKDRKNIILHDQLLPKRELIEIIKSSRIFILPSEHEAMSMMLLETISCKKKIICSNIPQNMEVVGVDYKYLFSFSKRNDLLNKMRLALDTEDDGEVTEALYQRCIVRFDWPIVAEQYQQVYNALLTKPMDR